MYLRDRRSIVLNYNAFIGFIPDPNPHQMNQVNNFLKIGNLIIVNLLY